MQLAGAAIDLPGKQVFSLRATGVQLGHLPCCGAQAEEGIVNHRHVPVKRVRMASHGAESQPKPVAFVVII